MRKLLQKTLLFSLILFAGFYVFPGTAKAAEKWLTGESVVVTKNGCDFLAFLSEDGKESWIHEVRINRDWLNKLTFPEKINNAPVTRIGYGKELYEEDDEFYYSMFHTTLEPWHECYRTDVKAETITSIEFPKTLTQIERGTFCGLKSLKKVEITDGVKTLAPYSFAACGKMKEVKLPAELEALDVSAFDASKKISKFTISKKSKNFKTKSGLILSKDSKKLIWAAPALKTVAIPKGVKQLEDNALFTSQAVKVVIPKSVRKIGYKALTGKDIEKIELKKGNKVYKMDGGSLYKKADKSLAAILVKNGKARISPKVKVLGGGISVMGAYYIERVDIPKSIKKVVGDWMFFLDYENDVTQKIYFHGIKPPKIVCKKPGTVFTAIPIYNRVYVPKKAKKAYIRWAKDRDGLKWSKLKTF